MSEADWAVVTGSLDAATIARGVTAGITPPNGGGAFIFGYNSRIATPGAAGFRLVQSNFAPLVDNGALPTGGSIRGAIQRGVSAGPLSFAPMLFIGLQGSDVAMQGYLLGLSDNDPHEVVLRKGSPIGGLDPDSTDVLRRSTGTFVPGTWLHLRLDMIVNPNGDTVLKVFRNDLGAHLVTAPTWEAVPGMDDYIDDALGIASGTLPFAGGYAGMAMQSADVSRRGFFDAIECLRQTG